MKAATATAKPHHTNTLSQIKKTIIIERNLAGTSAGIESVFGSPQATDASD